VLVVHTHDSGRCHVLRRRYTSRVQPSCFYFLANKTAASISGYAVPALAGGAGGAELWTLVFAGETLETFTTRSADEFVQSPVRTLPDRSVMYK
jgi:hypothetical protein